MKPARLSALSILLTSLILVSGWALAQELPGIPTEEAAPAAADPTDPAEIRERARQLAEQLADTEKSLGEASDAAERDHREAMAEWLRVAGALLQRQAALVEPLQATGEAPDSSLEQSVASPFALDSLYQARFDAEQAQAGRELAVTTARNALERAKEEHREAERLRREARVARDATTQAPESRAVQWTLELRQLASRAAQERVYLNTLELHDALRPVGSDDTVAALDERIAQMREELAGGGGDSRPGFVAATERAHEVRRQREAIERNLATAELRLDAAQKRFSAQAEPAPDLLAEIEALRVRRDALQQHVEFADSQIERITEQQITWRRWDALLRGKALSDELGAWKESGDARLEALELAERKGQGRLSDLGERISRLDAGAPSEPRLRRVVAEQREALSALLGAQNLETWEIAAERRLTERALADLSDRSGEFNPLHLATRAATALRDVWRYEITSVDDEPITIGSLVLAIALFSAGLWVSRRGSGLVGRFATRRLRLDAGASHALQTLAFYVLLVAFTLLALRAVRFPLTAFTVLGGALAIGIGFGSQNVMNNFISGLILMLERPVRARDIVEIEGNYGAIENIGARSTQIRSTDGRHIIVPNSFFLENNVVNWTLSDDLIRTHVAVGVVYGSPTRLVEQLIQRVVDEDAQVLKTPVPIVLFSAFGDNSLDFEVHFWVSARSPMGMKQIESRVRFRIDELFREHDLVIAFPQRDIHLDSVRPIEIRMVDEKNESDSKS